MSAGRRLISGLWPGVGRLVVGVLWLAVGGWLQAEGPSLPGLPPEYHLEVGLAGHLQLPAAATGQGGVVSYSLRGLPGGMVFDAAKRIVKGMPTTAGSYPVTYQAQAPGGKATRQTLFTVHGVQRGLLGEQLPSNARIVDPVDSSTGETYTHGDLTQDVTFTGVADGGKAPYWSILDAGGTQLGQPIAGYSFVYRFAAPGTYTVRFSVAPTAYYSASSAEITVAVSGSGSTVPTISSFTASPSTITAVTQKVQLAWVASGYTTLVLRKDGVQVGLPVPPYYDVTPGGSCTYELQAQGSGGTASRSVTVTLYSAPVFTQHPTSQTAVAEGTASFTALASGTPTPSYQWKKDGTPISGATSSTCTITNVQATHAGTYTVTATNSLGTATSGGATLAVSTAVPPAISTHPASRTVTAGQTATFSVVASGTPTPGYQWRKDGVLIAGGTGSSHTTPATTTADSGAVFTVVVTNSAGSVTSSGATLTVTPAAATAPVITTQPSSQSVPVGQPATFTVVASGTPTPSYQWWKNGALIAGGTGSSYTTPATTIADSGAVFTVAVTNSAGGATSQGAVLTVRTPGTMAWKRDIAYLGGRQVGEITPAGIHAVLTDHLGSPRLVVKPDGTVLEQKYAPFGESLSNPLATQQIAKGFTNHEQTDPSGLIYAQARFYLPMLVFPQIVDRTKC